MRGSTSCNATVCSTTPCWRLHIIDQPVAWLASDTAIYIGVVYSYLPFMVLPLYATLEKMDPALLEAAADLGCPRWKAFWRVTLPLVFARRRRRRLAVLHPDRRRIRHPGPARRLGDADDRADAVDRVLFQPRLAGGLGASPRRCSACCWCRSSSTSGCSSAPSKDEADAPRSLPVQRHRRRARLGLSLSADRHPGDLFVQRLAPGHALGRLVAALVPRTAARRADASGGLDQPACRGSVGNGGDGAWVRLSAVALTRYGAFRGRLLVFRHGLCAAGDAGSHHRPVAVAAVCRARHRSRLLDHRRRAHDADHVLRHGDRAFAACRFRPQPGGGGDGSRLPAASRPS